MPSVSVEVPIGSISENINTGFGTKNLNPTSLNSLANYSSSASLAYDNPAAASTCDVIVTLADINMLTSGYVRLDNGTDYYELTVPTGYSGKSVIFKTIPVAFLASFTIYNGTGVTLKSSGNYITVIPN